MLKGRPVFYDDIMCSKLKWCSEREYNASKHIIVYIWYRRLSGNLNQKVDEETLTKEPDFTARRTQEDAESTHSGKAHDNLENTEPPHL